MLKGLIDRVKHRELLESLNLPRDQYALTGGAWLAIMNIRGNEDIDLVIGEDLRGKYISYLNALDPVLRAKVEQYIDISGKHGKKQMRIARAKSLQHLIDNFSVNIEGHLFISYKLFQQYKKPRNRPKDKKDKEAMSRFFKKKKHLLPIYKGLFE